MKRLIALAFAALTSVAQAEVSASLNAGYEFTLTGGRELTQEEMPSWMTDWYNTGMGGYSGTFYSPEYGYSGDTRYGYAGYPVMMYGTNDPVGDELGNLGRASIWLEMPAGISFSLGQSAQGYQGFVLTPGQTVTITGGYGGSFSFEGGLGSMYWVSSLSSYSNLEGPTDSIFSANGTLNSQGSFGESGFTYSFTNNTDGLVERWFTVSATTVTEFQHGVAAPVPEPETYAMMLAGLGVVGLMARRRKAGALVA